MWPRHHKIHNCNFRSSLELTTILLFTFNFIANTVFADYIEQRHRRLSRYEYIFQLTRMTFPLRNFNSSEANVRREEKCNAQHRPQSRIKKQKWKTRRHQTANESSDATMRCCLCHMTSTCNIQDYFS